MQAPVTMADVARHSGVGETQVQWVLGGSKRPVSEESRRKVLAAARRLGFDPKNTTKKGSLNVQQIREKRIKAYQRAAEAAEEMALFCIQFAQRIERSVPPFHDEALRIKEEIHRLTEIIQRDKEDADRWEEQEFVKGSMGGFKKNGKS